MLRTWKNCYLCALLVEQKSSTAAVEKSLAVSQKVKHTELPYGPAVPLLGIYLQDLRAGVWAVSVHQCSQQQRYSQEPNGETTQVSIGRWMKWKNRAQTVLLDPKFHSVRVNWTEDQKYSGKKSESSKSKAWICHVPGNYLHIIYIIFTTIYIAFT